MARRRQDKIAAGYAAAQAGDLRSAEALYRQGIEDGDAFGNNNLAQLMIEAGRLREGERLFRRGAAAGDGLAARNLVLLLLEEGKEAEAEKVRAKFGRMMGANPTTAQVKAARAYRNNNTT